MRKNNPKKNFKFPKGADFDISIPEGGSTASLVLAISDSPNIRQNLSAYLLDWGIRVAGPFSSLSEAKNFLVEKIPNAVVFDTITNIDEFGEFIDLMTKSYPDIPILLITNTREKIKEMVNLKFSNLRMPLESNQIGIKLERYDLIGIEKTPEYQILQFTNDLFLEILELTPSDKRAKIEELIDNAINDFSSKNSDFTRKSEESRSLVLENASKINLENFITFLQFTLEDLIMDIDLAHDARWGEALVKDSIEVILMQLNNIPEAVSVFASKFGINTNIFKNSVDSIVPKLNDNEKSVFIAYMSLSDLGPELRNLVTNDQNIIEGIDDSVASQIITLVGQGSSYHEGIFGPIPIPTANNIIAIVWSRMLNSDIKDERMGGKSLSVVAIGLYRNLLTRLPPRNRLIDMFSIFDNIQHVREINQDLLFELERTFLDEL